MRKDFLSTWEEVYDYVEANGLTELHTATARGYQQKKVLTVELDYKGRYGAGIKVHWNMPNSSKYHNVTYFIKKEED